MRARKVWIYRNLGMEGVFLNDNFGNRFLLKDFSGTLLTRKALEKEMDKYCRKIAKSLQLQITFD